MAEHEQTSTATREHAAPETQVHASIATYVKVAAILTVVTALEFGVIYIRALTPILVPLLIVLSAGKFALVVMFFMHLRYDTRSLATLFVGPLVIAAGLAVALMTLTGAFLVFGR
jgi:cytochrome c oxidase subunit 4